MIRACALVTALYVAGVVLTGVTVIAVIEWADGANEVPW